MQSLDTRADGALLTVPEAADFLRCKPSTIRDWVLHRRLTFVRVGRLIRFRRADLEKLIAQSTVPPQEGGA